MIEFVDAEVRSEYSYLKMQEEDLQDELDDVKRKIRDLEKTADRY